MASAHPLLSCTFSAPRDDTARASFGNGPKSIFLKVSKCGNYEQHALRVRVEDAANDHWEDFWERLTFSDVAMWKVEQTLQGVGLDAGGEREILPEDRLEKRCRVELVEKEGKLQIKRWIPAQRVSKPPVAAKPAAVMRL